MTAVMVVSLTTIMFVVAVPPTVAAVAPVKLVPVMVTEVPPSVVPLVGEIEVTVGGSATLPIAKSLIAVNQIAPSGPVVISKGPLFPLLAKGVGNSVICGFVGVAEVESARCCCHSSP